MTFSGLVNFKSSFSSREKCADWPATLQWREIPHRRVNRLCEVIYWRRARANLTIWEVSQTYLWAERDEHFVREGRLSLTFDSVCSLAYSSFSWICQAACFFSLNRAWWLRKAAWIFEADLSARRERSSSSPRDESFALPEAVESRVIIWNFSGLSVIEVTWGTIWMGEDWCFQLILLQWRERERMLTGTHTIILSKVVWSMRGTIIKFSIDTHLCKCREAHRRERERLRCHTCWSTRNKNEMEDNFSFSSSSSSPFSRRRSRYLYCD